MANELDIDLRDPSVRQLMGTDRSVVGPGDGHRQMVQLAGDQVDPTGYTQARGIMSTRRLDGGKIEVCVDYRGRYGDQQMTVDLYALPGEPIYAILLCPKCHQAGTIRAENKKIEYDPRRARDVYWHDYKRVVPNGGELSIEPFECSFEMPDAGEHVVGLRSGGLTLCKAKLVIENNVARDA